MRKLAVRELPGQELARKPADQRADEQVGHEHAHGDGQTGHTASQHEVGQQGDRQRAETQTLRVPGEQVLYRALGRRQQQRRDLVVGAAFAVVPTVGQGAQSPVQALTFDGFVADIMHCTVNVGAAMSQFLTTDNHRREAEDHRDDGGVTRHLEDLDARDMRNAGQHPPPQRPHGDQHLREESADQPCHSGEQGEQRYVQPLPGPHRHEALLVDQEPMYI
mmetsp:Transcript_18042/g.52045  ORF Transcript_18042/g.52045 Transcript_18042/m.52045 type:complete len:220 (-) Transcript_18042:9-668(-)